METRINEPFTKLEMLKNLSVLLQRFIKANGRSDAGLNDYELGPIMDRTSRRLAAATSFREFTQAAESLTTLIELNSHSSPASAFLDIE